MSMKFLYGLSYDELNPPKDWPAIGVQATILDDAFEASIDVQEFIFAGPAATFLKNWQITYGVHVGCPFRITDSDDSGNLEIIFDGMINLRDMTILSKENPILYQAPVQRFNQTATVLDQLQVITQGLLEQQGYLTNADYVDIPVIRESKKNVAERSLILGQLGYQVVTTFIRVVQDFLSAISDALGLSIAIGLIEILLLFVNTVIQVNLLVDQILKHKDLLFPLIHYYKGISLKKIIEKGAEKLGYTVDFGIIDDVISNVYLLGSQNDNDGSLFQNFPASGRLKSGDYGYRVGEAIAGTQLIFNTRQHVSGNVLNIKTKTDPDWENTPLFNPVNTKLETTEQYSNGTFKNDVENIYGVTYISYQYDPTDTHTLTENNDDAHEIHRSPINLPDERLNLMRGIQDIQIPWAMMVRKGAFDNLLDLFYGISDKFDEWLDYFQVKINQFASNIDQNANAGTYIQEVLDMTPLGSVFQNRNGCLKIDDNTYGLPKIGYLEQFSVGLRLPTNFKDFIGAKAIYDNYYFPESPSIQNNFAGQKVLRLGWQIPFSLQNWQDTLTNPFFQIDSTNAKFNSINWQPEQHKATTDAEQDEIFDTNITENEIT